MLVAPIPRPGHVSVMSPEDDLGPGGGLAQDPVDVVGHAPVAMVEALRACRNQRAGCLVGDTGVLDRPINLGGGFFLEISHRGYLRDA